MCERYGVRYSEFLQWDADDRHKAVMHRMRQQQRCTGCGTHPDDWDPEKGGFVDAFIADVHTCPGCAATQKKQKRDGDSLGPGDSIRLRRFDPESDDMFGG